MLSVYVVSAVLVFCGNSVQCNAIIQDSMPIAPEANEVELLKLSVETDMTKSFIEEISPKSKISGHQNANQRNCIPDRMPSNCAEALRPTQKSGIYTLKVRNFGPPFDVYCDADTFGGNWTVFQRRLNGSLNFFRNWADYKKGFGNLVGEFFIGLDKLHALTMETPHELLFELENFDREIRYAKYASFAVYGEDTDFKMSPLGKYSGNAGNAFLYHQKMKFSSRDRDNDEWGKGSCANKYKGAWWYNNCRNSNLNGLYPGAKHNQVGEGMEWKYFVGPNSSLKRTQMLIRPIY